MTLGKPETENLQTEGFIFPASFAQQRLWFLEQLWPGTALYTSPLVFRVTGELHQEALEGSIRAIAHRHESLRTTFALVDGQLMQVIAPEVEISLKLVNVRQEAAGDQLSTTDCEAIALEQIRQEIDRPFSLEQGPLLRVGLWRLNNAEYLLLFALHHIIFDEWSSGVLIRELGELYAAGVESRSVALAELPVQYADFALWQREWLQGEVLNAQLQYWRQQLKDVPKLNLSSIQKQLTDRSNRGANQQIELPQRLLNELENLSQQSGVTLFMTLLAAFQTLLHRYSGQTDIAIGSPIANRHRSELEGLIGFLVNSLVLRTNLAGDPPFLELLERVREITLAAYDHQDLPFEKLVEELQPVRSLGQNPLFQVVFALQNAPMVQLELPSLRLSPIEFEVRTARFDLEIYLWKSDENFRSLWGKGWQQSDGLRGVVIYNTDLFDEDAIATLRHQFQTLLESIIAKPHTRLSALPLLTPEEQQARWVAWNQTSTPYPMDCCIHELFEQQAAQHSGAIALQFGHQSFPYEAFNQGSNQLARYLHRQGLRSGMRVGICLERSAGAVAAMLAALKAGAAYVPLDPSYPPERLHFLLKDADISLVVTQAQWADSLRTEATTPICLDYEWGAISQESTENLATPLTADQPAYVIYTSGSTGTPKGVVVPHRAVNRLVCNTNYVQIELGDRIAHVASLSFDAATFEIWGALLNGATLVGIQREITLNPPQFAATLQREKIDTLFLTTALLNQTVAQIPDAFRSLKYLLFGGETANVERVRSLLHHGKPQHLLHVYGPTENTTFSTWYEVENVPRNATTIPIGRAIANTQVYLLDENLNPVPDGVVGEIYLSGDGLANGYLNHRELTLEKFIEIEDGGGNGVLRLYRTGDRASYNQDSNLEFIGRTDYQIKIRGFRVELGEIETALRQHPAIRDVSVVIRDIEGFSLVNVQNERQLVAYVVPQSTRTLTERDLKTFLKTTLPDYMIPAAFILLEALPLTANGKVDRKALPSPDLLTVNHFSSVELLQESSLQSAESSIAPTNSVETLLVNLWRQLLGRRQVGIHDNFFELGGHSLLATQLVSRVRDQLQVELPLRSVFETPTIAALAHQVEALLQDRLIADSNDRPGSNARSRRLAWNVDLEALPPGAGARASGEHFQAEPGSEVEELSAGTITRKGLQPTVQTEYFPLSFAQQRLWFLYQLAPENSSYNIPAAIRLKGHLNRTVLERSLNEIVRRHAALRTSFTVMEGQPMQAIAPALKISIPVVDLQSAVEPDNSGELRSNRILQQLATAEVQRPFNLTADPLLRVTLLQVGPTETVLLLTLHHIVADGWSLGVLIRELGQCYSALLEGQVPELPELSIQYTDFSCWQRSWFRGRVLEQQLAYWREQLRDLPALQLPTDFPRAAAQTHRGATYSLNLPAALTQSLEQLSQQAGVSLFMTLLAAFQVLLHRYTGQEDIAVGSPIANRHRSELEGLIGFFVNPLVMRSHPTTDLRFCDFLEQVREVALAAYTHQDLPFEKLVEDLEPDREANRNPLVQVAFALQNAPMQALELPGLTLEPFPLESGSTRFDLEIHLWEPSHGLSSLWQSQEGLSGFISYSMDLFERGAIARLAGHFQTLLAGIVAYPEARLAELPLLTAGELQQILIEWSGFNLAFGEPPRTLPTFTESPPNPQSWGRRTSGGSPNLGNLGGENRSDEAKLDWPVSDRRSNRSGENSLPIHCFDQIFESQVIQSPHALAVVSEARSLTYHQLNQQANHLAQLLRHRGVKPGDRVGLSVDRSTDMVVGVLGILKAGAAFVPMDPGYPGDRLQFMLEDTGVTVLLTQSWLMEKMMRSQAQIICLDQVNGSGDVSDMENPDSGSSLDSPAYGIYTSGSTGTPKGVLLAHRGLSNVVMAQRQFFDPSQQSRILQFSSLSFDASVFEIALAFGSGGTLYIPPPSAQLPGMELVRFLRDNAITHALLTPAVLAVLPNADFPDLNVLITGGETCSSAVVDRWASGRRFFNAYGPTEATIWATLAELRPGDSPLTIGRPIANTQTYILDNALNPVPAGIPGELYLGGVGVAQGYLNRPELTAERFIEWIPPVSRTGETADCSDSKTGARSHLRVEKVRLYRTGDRARYRSDGSIEFLGRVDTQVKIRGFRVELGEIEATLQQHPAVQDAVVLVENRGATAASPPAGDARLMAYFTLDRQYLRQTLVPPLQAQHLQHWQTLYDQTYQSLDAHNDSAANSAHVSDSTFNITGWNSSYTGEAIPAEEMQEWVSDRTQQILALKPRRVLEIGCGTGLVLFQIAPHCEEYVGTDFSKVSLNSIQRQLDTLRLPHVKLLHQLATDFDGIESGAFDVVILNSVVQYFPSQEYLLQVLEGALDRVAVGGMLFVGDVRSLPLLDVFHTWVQFSQADARMERTELRQRVRRSRFEETELAIDPMFFEALGSRLPKIKQTQIYLSRGRYENEMTQFRYNVLIHVCNEPINVSQKPTLESIQEIDWKQDSITIRDLTTQLLEQHPEIFTLKNVTNARVNAAVRTTQWLYSETTPRTVGRMRELLQLNVGQKPILAIAEEPSTAKFAQETIASLNQGIAPQDWWDLEAVLPYRVEISWSADLRSGDYDVFFIRNDIEPGGAIAALTKPTPPNQPWSHYTNDPLQSQAARQLISQLRHHLSQSLPTYMLPTALIPLSALPLTPNGKVDRRALPSQMSLTALEGRSLSPTSSNTSSLQTPTETTLTHIWRSLLGLQQVGRHENFFELGGHSLLATQMTSRIRDTFGLELPLKNLFESPTIAQLSTIIDTLRNAPVNRQVPALVRRDRALHRFSHQPNDHSSLGDRVGVAVGSDTARLRPTCAGVAFGPDVLDSASVCLPNAAPLRASHTSASIRVHPHPSAFPLVPLTLSSTQFPFFCVHPMFGVVLPYLELAQTLCTFTDRSFYGLQPLGLDGQHPPLNRIEAIATYYIQAIQTLQPEGPYYLGGWSFGGLVAYEMARQLTQAGHSIALLAILDTTIPASQQRSPFQNLKFLLGTALWSSLPFLLNYGAISATHSSRGTASEFPEANPLSKATGHLKRWFSRWQWAAIASQFSQSGIANSLPEAARLRLMNEAAIGSLMRIVYANGQATYHYRPKSYSGKVTLFRASQQPDPTIDEALGWNTLAQTVQVHTVPGNHLSLLQQPHVRTLAEQLGQYLH